MTPLSYTNFNGQKRTTKLYFHVTPRELADWMFENGEKADRLIADFEKVRVNLEANEGVDQANLSQEDVRTMLRLVRVLAELSYGTPSDDGEVFDKSDINRFVHSAAYDAFRMFLFENPKELETFLTSLLSEDVVKEFGDRMSKLEGENAGRINGTEELRSVTGPTSPRELSREELEKAYLEKVQGTAPTQ